MKTATVHAQAELLTEPTSGVKELQTVDRLPAECANLVLMFERLAKDPAVDVEKLQRLIDMQKDILRINSEAAFWDAFAEMQGDLPTITEDGSIVVDGKVRSRYSTNENIQECVRPILQRHGFSLSFRNANVENRIKVTGILAHRGGHRETDDFESAPDNGGSMNSIQRIGSTRSYGQRYTTIALLNIVSRAPQDRDKDGEGSDAPEPPDGLDAWWAIVEGLAADGTTSVEDAFGRGSAAFKNYIVNYHRNDWNALKAKAAAASKAKRGRS